MYKKIFSAILFGVLTIASTSTFVSCKDYDDDIKNLQEQINDLVNTKIATINTTITTLQTNLTTLENNKLDKSEFVAAKALLEKAIADLEDAHKKDVADLKAKDIELDAAITKANKQIEDILKLLSDQDGNIQQVGKDLKALNDKLTKFESEFGTLSDAFRTLNQKVTNLEDAVAAQKAALAALAEQIGTGTDHDGYNDTELKNKIDAAGNKISDLETKLSQLQSSFNTEIANLKAELAKKADITDLQALKTAHTNFATQVTNELETLKTNISNVKDQAEATATALGQLDVMFNILVSDLRSLVYMPKLYVDGIETIEYPYLKYALLHKADVPAFTRYENDLTGPRAPQNIDGIYDLVDKVLNDDVSYGPAWPLEYHMNPGNAQVEFSDIQGYYAYNAEVLTRAFYDEKQNMASTWGMIPVDRWDNQYDENDIFFQNVAGTKGDVKNYAGNLVVGLKLGDKVASANGYFPGDLAEDANDGQSPESVSNIILALQAKSSLVNKKDTTITSDYAQLLPEKVKIEGLIWYKGKTPTYWDNDNGRIVDFWENKKGYGKAKELAFGANPGTPTYQHNPAGWNYGYRKGTQGQTMGRDTICPVTKDWIHVWDTPEDALTHPADIELYINKPISLVEHLGVHWYFEQEEPLTKNVVENKPMKTWYYNDKMLQRYGFVWVFDTLDYTCDANKTHDSRYIQIKNHKTGLIDAQNVKENGVTYEDETHTAVGREPLVRVRLFHFSNIKDMNTWKNIESVGVKKFNDDNDVTSGKYAPVLDGYIRVHITRPELLQITSYPTWPVTFNLCDPTTAGPSTWAQFSKFVLTDKMDNMEKEQFDALYNVEQEGSVDDVNKSMELVQYVTPRSTSSENEYYKYKKLAAAPGNWAPNKNNMDEYKIGRIWTRYDEVGTTNHIYYWTISAEEMESLTHHASGDNGENGVVVTRWIHYTGHFYSSTDPNNAGAKYDDIFIKLSMKITRDNVEKSETSKKDENYWYKLDNSLNNWFRVRNDEALWSIANNTEYPKDGGSTIPWVNDILKTWDQNKVNVTKTGAQSYAVTADDNSTVYGKPTKFYFAPFDLSFTVSNLDGTSTTYHVTPKRGADDTYYDKFICKYFSGNKHQFVLKPAGNQAGTVDEDANNAILNSCAINFGPDNNNIKRAYNMDVKAPKDANQFREWSSRWPMADGVFSNDTLYAYTNAAAKEYEPIAIIQNTNVNAADGGAEVILLHEYVQNKWLNGSNCYSDGHIGEENEFSEALVNAVGRDVVFERESPSGKLTGKWEDQGNPIGKQLRSYVGVIATNKCNIANQMTDKAIGNFAVFQMPWERPINIVSDVDIMIDAHNNADYIYMVDIIKLFDWRGLDKTVDNEFDKGYMWGDTPDFLGQSWGKRQWLWAYYNVKEIVVDLRTDHVYTNLSETSDTKIQSENIKSDWNKLTNISNKVLLTGAAGAYSNADKKYHYVFDLRNPINYNSLAQNDALIQYMGLDHAWQETIDVDKARFGYIMYENNGQNVHDFDVAVPVSVRYDWGWIEDRLVRIHIYGTLFNH